MPFSPLGATVETLYSAASGEPLVVDTDGGNLNEKASARVYMIIDRIDFEEALAMSKCKPNLAPYFADGIKKLAKQSPRAMSASVRCS